MGQSCTRKGDVVEDGEEIPLKKRNSKKNSMQKADKRTSAAQDTQAAAAAATRADDPTQDQATSPSEEFSVVTKIEALLHTMRPTVSVVSGTDLHPEFRQFTSIFAPGNAALSVVSCQDAGLTQQVLMTGEDRSIAQFNYETGHVMRRWVCAHSKAIRRLTRPTASGLFASCGRDCAVKVWNLNRDLPIATLLGHTLDVTSVDVDTTGSFVISGGDDNTVRLWDIAHAGEIYCAKMKQNAVTFVRELPKLNLIAQGGDDLAVRLWDVRMPPNTPAMTLAKEMTETDYVPLCCDYSPSVYSRLLTGHSGAHEEGGYVQEWDLRMGCRVHVYKGHESSVVSLCVSTSALYGDTTFFTASSDGTIGLWSMELDTSRAVVVTLPVGHQFRVPEGVMTCCECEANGDIVATLRSGAVVVFRPQREGSTIVPARRFRYVGPMDESRSLDA